MYRPNKSHPLESEGNNKKMMKCSPCCCASEESDQQTSAGSAPFHVSGCMVCGAALIYIPGGENKTCYYCGEGSVANAQCSNGHFVCDRCHKENGSDIIARVCLHDKEPDAAKLMQSIRRHDVFPIHGPEHHSLVPAVILAALRNNGATVPDDQIRTAIQRGHEIPGGACAFLGVCGAAAGVGIAFSVLSGADPYNGEKRQLAQQAANRALSEIASYKAPRCCQRDSWLALNVAADIFREKKMTSFPVAAFRCEQHKQNYECIHSECPLWADK